MSGQRKSCSLRDKSGRMFLHRQPRTDSSCYSLTPFLLPLPSSHTHTHTQVLTLQGLGLALGDTYIVAWELDPVEEAYQRFDCHPEENADEAKCKARGCIWEVRGDTDDGHTHRHTLVIYSVTKQLEKQARSDFLQIPFI